MKYFLALTFALSLFTMTGCGGSGENTVIEKEDLDQYNIPEGEMEKAMEKAMNSTKKKK